MQGLTNLHSAFHIAVGFRPTVVHTSVSRARTNSNTFTLESGILNCSRLDLGQFSKELRESDIFLSRSQLEGGRLEQEFLSLRLNGARELQEKRSSTWLFTGSIVSLNEWAGGEKVGLGLGRLMDLSPAREKAQSSTDNKQQETSIGLFSMDLEELLPFLVPILYVQKRRACQLCFSASPLHEEVCFSLSQGSSRPSCRINASSKTKSVFPLSYI